jgi:hypothetical protein
MKITGTQHRLTLLAVCAVLVAACTEAKVLTEGDHRLVGIWEHELQTEHDWDQVLEMEEASFSQMILLSDGRFIHGGLILGHPFVEESRWEVSGEGEGETTIRVTRSDGRIEDMALSFRDDDSLVMKGPNDTTMPFRRGREVAPVPWLKEAVAR